MATVADSNLMWDLFKALGFNGFKYVTSVDIHMKANDIVIIDITCLLEEDEGKAMVEVMKHYYLMEKT